MRGISAHGSFIYPLTASSQASRGNYSESDIPDPVDLYGRSKLLGELDRQGCLTLRTSIIGWELKNQASLLEWFALQRGRIIKGFRHAIYTGLSTSVLSDLIGWLLETRPDLSGIYQVAGSPISKYDLLLRMRDALHWNDITIESDDDFHCDRSLIGDAFHGNHRMATPGMGSNDRRPGIRMAHIRAMEENQFL